MPYDRFPTRQDGVDKNKAGDVNVLNTGLGNATAGVFNVFENGAKGDGATDDATNLTATDNANGGDGVTHFPATTGGYLIGSNATLNHPTRLPPGAKFKPASGKTLTLNGYLDAGPYQIFDTSAGGSVALASHIIAKPEWWGTGAAALHAACNSGASTVALGLAAYTLDAIQASNADYLKNAFVGLPSSKALIFQGSGPGTVIKIADHFIDQATDSTSNAHMFGNTDTSVGVAGVTFRDLTLDGNGPNNLTPSGKTRTAMAVRLETGRDVLFENVTFLDIPGHNAVCANMNTGKNLRFVNCTIRNGGHSFSGNVLNANNSDWSGVYSLWEFTDTSGLVIDNEYPDLSLQNPCGGVELHGSNSRADNMSVKGCDPAVYLVSETTALVNQSALGLHAYQCRRGVCIGTAGASLAGVQVRDGEIQLYLPPINGGSIYAVGVEVLGGMSKSTTFSAAQAISHPIADLDISDMVTDGSLLPVGTTNAMGVRVHSVNGGSVKRIRGRNLPQPALFLDSSPWGMVGLTVEDMDGVDIGIGAASPGQASTLLANFTGNAGTPNLPCFWKDIRLENIRGTNRHVETFDSSGNVLTNACTGAIHQVVELLGLASTNKIDNFHIYDVSGSNVIHDIQGTATAIRPDLVHPQVHFHPRVVTAPGWPLTAGKFFGSEIIQTSDGATHQCTLAGNVSPPTGVTATISLSTPTIATVSSATGIRVGMQVAIAGAGASGGTLFAFVASIANTALTLDTAASTAVAGAAVTITKPTFLFAAGGRAWKQVSGAYTVLPTDYGIDATASGGAFTITLPAASSVPDGQIFEVMKVDSSANAVTVAAASINGVATKVLSAQYAYSRFRSDGNSKYYAS